MMFPKQIGQIIFLTVLAGLIVVGIGSAITAQSADEDLFMPEFLAFLEQRSEDAEGLSVEAMPSLEERFAPSDTYILPATGGLPVGLVPLIAFSTLTAVGISSTIFLARKK